MFLFQKSTLLVFCLVLLLNGCGVEVGDTPSPLASQAISLAEAGPFNLAVGDTLSNSASSSGNSGGAITYSSSDTSVATIDSAGVILGVAPGTAIISATQAADDRFDAATGHFTVTVVLASQSIAFAQDGPMDLPVGDTLTNSASGGSGSGAITYSSNDTRVASVDSVGLVSAVGAGTAIISATQAADTQYASATTSYTVNVILASQSIAFAQVGPLDLPLAETLTNSASGSGSAAITYSSSDTGVATVDSAGLVTTVNVGSSTISATQAADNQYASATISYTLNVVLASQSISFAQTGPLDLPFAETLTNTATGGAGSGATTYNSSDTGVATVDSAGQVTTVNVGTTTISATKAADTLYAATTSSYDVNVIQAEQSIAFAQIGPFNLLLGDFQTNAASGSGGGAITYSSDDTSVATVDSAGRVTTVDLGTSIISATQAADTQYAAATGSYSVTVTLIAFGQVGPFDLLVGDTQTNTATGSGNGAITYSSDDTGVATVDSVGLLSVVGVGSTAIRATKAADSQYAIASASYTVNAAPSSVAISAWIGATDTEITLPASADGLEFFRSSEAGCDLLNYASCTDGQLDFLNSSPITDSAAKLTQAGYYTLQHGSNQAKLVVGAEHFSKRNRHQTVTFNDKLWLIGGNDGSFKNDVWLSDDGITWAEQTANAAFTARADHQIVTFNNKLWLIGGEDIGGVTNDIWFSIDGINWVEQTTIGTLFSARSSHQVVTFDSQLWLIGGADIGGDTNDIWSSIDGETWVERTPSAGFSARFNHQVVALNNKLWLSGGEDANGIKQSDLWSSDNGYEWVKLDDGDSSQTRSDHQLVTYDNKLYMIGGQYIGYSRIQVWLWVSSFSSWLDVGGDSPLTRSGYQVTVFKNQLWLTGGQDDSAANQNHVWSSDDGSNWVEQTPRADFSARGRHQAVTFLDKLWLIGGNDGVARNDVWSSDDGIIWTEKTNSAAFSARYDHQIVTFLGKLWLIGGNDGLVQNDIWSSVDGINWVKQATSELFTDRSMHQVVTFNSKLWLIGGVDAGSSKNDVWSSVDGTTWVQQTVAAPFSARVGHEIVSFDSKLWLIGGNGGGYNNDVWSSVDGNTWVEQTTIGTLFSARAYHQVVTFNGKLWVIGGYDSAGRKNDIWSSDDGINWVVETGSAAFSARQYHQVVTLNNNLWLMGGEDSDGNSNDVWTSTNGIDWRLGYQGTFQFQ